MLTSDQGRSEGAFCKKKWLPRVQGSHCACPVGPSVLGRGGRTPPTNPSGSLGRLRWLRWALVDQGTPHAHVALGAFKNYRTVEPFDQCEPDGARAASTFLAPEFVRHGQLIPTHFECGEFHGRQSPSCGQGRNPGSDHHLLAPVDGFYLQGAGNAGLHFLLESWVVGLRPVDIGCQFLGAAKNFPHLGLHGAQGSIVFIEPLLCVDA